MKTLITISLFFLSLSAFSQNGNDSRPGHTNPIKDTVRIETVTGFDTVKVNIVYIKGDNLKVQAGYAVRKIRNSTNEQPQLLAVIFYDNKWKRFTKPVFDVK